MKPIIEVEKIGKRYRLGEGRAPYSTLRESLVGALRSPLKRRRRKEPSEKEVVWALKDVSFDVHNGEVVGIIGRNGAGKSTLLKVLSQITEPTTGCARLYGRVGSLLEVGTGFHPELTGKENIYLNGAILGMARSDIEKQFDEIIAFAEVERFINTPVKRYSSGMYLRLAFAVAAHLEPEILVIDEVLAVGDAAFQKKCLGKMGDVAKQGRTVLFVSHNMSAVKQLCSRGILLNSGRIAAQGSINEVLNAYATMVGTNSAGEVVFKERDDSPASFTRLCLRNSEGTKVSAFSNSEPIIFEIEYVVRETLTEDHIWLVVDRADGLRVLKTADDDRGAQLPAVRSPGRYITSVQFPAGVLNDGVYQYFVGIGKPRGLHHDHRWGEHFEVQVTSIDAQACLGQRNGVILVPLDWSEQQIV